MIGRKTLFLLLFSVVIIFYTCNGVKDIILPHTALVFPTEKGHYTISYVVDTTFNTSGEVVNRYYKKEEIGGIEQDLLGRDLTLLQTYISPEELGTNYNFEEDQLWALYKAPEEQIGSRFAERIEDNIRTVVLKFPVYPYVGWNGNLYNNRGTQEFFYENVDTTVVLNGKTFENCVLVVHQADTTSAISYRYTYEIYAPNVGRIKRYSKVIVNDLPPNGMFNPSKSRIYVEEIVAHN